MIRKKENIKDYISIERKISKKTEKVLLKNIDELSIVDLYSLLKIEIAEQFCLKLILEKIDLKEINFEFDLNNKDYEQNIVLLNEIILLNPHNWDINPKAFEYLKKIISKNIQIINLKEKIINKFLNYIPDKLNWNKDVVNEFNSYMNDTRMGVFCAYKMITARKRRIINGGKIKYSIKEKKVEITNLKEFEENILASININMELKEILSNIKN